MKPSLEEERRALLEQIEASRAVYRRMLAGSESESSDVTVVKPGTSLSAQTFPRSRTVRWVMDHPWWIAFGVAAVVWAGPGKLKGLFGRARSARTHSSKTVKGITSVGAMLLRDQSKLRAAGRLAVMGLGLLQRRRARKNTLKNKAL